MARLGQASLHSEGAAEPECAGEIADLDGSILRFMGKMKFATNF